MGRFSITIQIKNNTNREEFIKSFCEAMKKRGFLPCSEDEAAVSYLLGFSGGWVTLTNEDYSNNPKKAETDVSELSKEMKTAVFSVEVVDSDFAILNFNGDMVIVGDGSGYGFEEAPKGDLKLWEPLLADGKTWEEFSENVNKDEVFAEDALCDVAKVLGIEPRYICSDHKDFSEAEDDDENIMAFHFKRAVPLLTLNAAFNKVFGEGLEPLGFKRLKKTKNKYPFYVRVINGEILHIVTFRQISSEKIGYKSIEVLGGVATVYRKDLSFLYNTLNPQDELPNTMRQFWNYPELEVDESFMKSATTNNYVWMYGMKGLTGEQEIRENFRCSISHFLISSENNDEMLKNLDMAFNVLKNVTLQILDKTSNLDSCIDYFYRHKKIYLRSFDEMINDGRSEALLLVKANYRGDGIARMEKDLDAISKKPRITQQELDQKRKDLNAQRLNQISLRDEMIDDSELNKRVLEELECRKAANIEKLRSYGLFDEPAIKSAPKQETQKPMTLNAAFIKVFGGGLEPLGFKRLKKIKNKQPYYVRVVNGEILHVVTYRTLSSHKPKYKRVEILGGAVTVYRGNLDFLYHTLNPMSELPDIMELFCNYPELEVNEDLMKSVVRTNYAVTSGAKDILNDHPGLGANEEFIKNTNDKIMEFTAPENLRKSFDSSIMSFFVNSENSEEMLAELDEAFNVVKNVTLKILDNVTNLDQCIDYFSRTGFKLDLCPFDEFITSADYGSQEGLILVKNNYRGSGNEKMERDLAGWFKYRNDLTQQEMDQERKERDARRLEQIALRDEMIDDPELNKRVLAELERRKAANIERLKELGLEI